MVPGEVCYKAHFKVFATVIPFALAFAPKNIDISFHYTLTVLLNNEIARVQLVRGFQLS